MSGHPHSRSIAALFVGTTLLATLVVVAVVSAASGGMAAAEAAPAADAASPMAQAEPALVTANASVESDASTTLRLSLTEVPDGLAGFELTLELTTPGVAAFEDATYPDRYGHTSTPAIADDGQSITVEAVDLHDEVTAGDADVALASVSVRGEAAGETQATVTGVQVDADGGDRIQPALDPGAVRVTADESADPSTAAASAVGSSDGDSGDATSPDDDADRLDPLRLGAVVVLVLASLVGTVAVRLRGWYSRN